MEINSFNSFCTFPGGITFLLLITCDKINLTGLLFIFSIVLTVSLLTEIDWDYFHPVQNHECFPFTEWFIATGEGSPQRNTSRRYWQRISGSSVIYTEKVNKANPVACRWHDNHLGNACAYCSSQWARFLSAFICCHIILADKRTTLYFPFFLWELHFKTRH